MANPNRCNANGGTFTAGQDVVIESLSGERVLISGPGLNIKSSNVAVEALELLNNVTDTVVSPGGIVRRDGNGDVWFHSFDATGTGTIERGAFITGDCGTGTPLQINLGFFGDVDLVGIKIRAADGQTGNLQEWNDRDNTPGAWVDKDYILHAKGFVTEGSPAGQNPKTIIGSKTLASADGTEGTVDLTGLGLSVGPVTVDAWVVKGDSLSNNVFATVIAEDMGTTEFDYSLSGIPTDGSVLWYVLYFT